MLNASTQQEEPSEMERNDSRSEEIWAVQVLPVLEVRYRF